VTDCLESHGSEMACCVLNLNRLLDFLMSGVVVCVMLSHLLLCTALGTMPGCQRDWQRIFAVCTEEKRLAWTITDTKLLRLHLPTFLPCTQSCVKQTSK